MDFVLVPGERTFFSKYRLVSLDFYGEAERQGEIEVGRIP